MSSEETLNDLAFLYLACSHLTDGEMAKEEIRVLAAEVQAFDPSLSLGALGEVLRRTVDRYKAIEGEDARLAATRESAVRLAGDLDEERKEELLSSLRRLTEADGEVGDNERLFVEAVERTLRS